MKIQEKLKRGEATKKGENSKLNWFHTSSFSNLRYLEGQVSWQVDLRDKGVQEAQQLRQYTTGFSDGQERQNEGSEINTPV